MCRPSGQALLTRRQLRSRRAWSTLARGKPRRSRCARKCAARYCAEWGGQLCTAGASRVAVHVTADVCSQRTRYVPVPDAADAHGLTQLNTKCTATAPTVEMQHSCQYARQLMTYHAEGPQRGSAVATPRPRHGRTSCGCRGQGRTLRVRITSCAAALQRPGQKQAFRGSCSCSPQAAASTRTPHQITTRHDFTRCRSVSRGPVGVHGAHEVPRRRASEPLPFLGGPPEDPGAAAHLPQVSKPPSGCS